MYTWAYVWEVTVVLLCAMLAAAADPTPSAAAELGERLQQALRTGEGAEGLVPPADAMAALAKAAGADPSKAEGERAALVSRLARSLGSVGSALDEAGIATDHLEIGPLDIQRSQCAGDLCSYAVLGFATDGRRWGSLETVALSVDDRLYLAAPLATDMAAVAEVPAPIRGLLEPSTCDALVRARAEVRAPGPDASVVQSLDRAIPGATRGQLVFDAFAQPAGWDVTVTFAPEWSTGMAAWAARACLARHGEESDFGGVAGGRQTLVSATGPLATVDRSGTLRLRLAPGQPVGDLSACGPVHAILDGSVKDGFASLTPGRSPKRDGTQSAQRLPGAAKTLVFSGDLAPRVVASFTRASGPSEDREAVRARLDGCMTTWKARRLHWDARSGAWLDPDGNAFGTLVARQEYVELTVVGR